MPNSKEYLQQYYLKNKEKYYESLERNRSTYEKQKECKSCDKFISRDHWAEHLRTKLHQNMLNIDKDKLEEINKNRIKCECGSKVLKNNYNRHLTSKKHLEKIK